MFADEVREAMEELDNEEQEMSWLERIAEVWCGDENGKYSGFRWWQSVLIMIAGLPLFIVWPFIYIHYENKYSGPYTLEEPDAR